GHFAAFIVLSVFQGFQWLTDTSRTELNLGGGDPIEVSAITLPPIAPPASEPQVPEVELPPPPEPETVDIEEPAIDIPDIDSEVEFAPPTPPKEEKKEEPKPKP